MTFPTYFYLWCVYNSNVSLDKRPHRRQHHVQLPSNGCHWLKFQFFFLRNLSISLASICETLLQLIPSLCEGHLQFLCYVNHSNLPCHYVKQFIVPCSSCVMWNITTHPVIIWKLFVVPVLCETLQLTLSLCESYL
jgi:hypothetical protein